MKTAVFLQVRLDSTRLPRKALKILGDRTVIEHAMGSLKRVRADEYVILTTESDAEELLPLAKKNNFSLFTGPKDDVLKRFVLASEKYGPDIIIRATGDNPLVSSEIAEEALELSLRKGADYCAVTGSPIGTGVEILKSTALQDAESRTSDSYCREHVAPYLYQNPERYRVVKRDSLNSDYLSPERVTLDTQEDYQFLQTLFQRLYSGSPVSLKALVSCIGEKSL